jgi:hypothetical protein
MLLAVKNEIAKPLSMLFNRWIQEMFFPDQWKIAHDSYDNLKSFCGSQRGGVSLDELSFFLLTYSWIFQYNLSLADFNSSKLSFIFP